jgi:hypothetical protein
LALPHFACDLLYFLVPLTYSFICMFPFFVIHVVLFLLHPSVHVLIPCSVCFCMKLHALFQLLPYQGQDRHAKDSALAAANFTNDCPIFGPFFSSLVFRVYLFTLLRVWKRSDGLRLEHFLHMASLNYHPQCVILIGECFLLSF